MSSLTVWRVLIGAFAGAVFVWGAYLGIALNLVREDAPPGGGVPPRLAKRSLVFAALGALAGATIALFE